MPPFTDAELQPRLANLATGTQAPDGQLAKEYNRALFDNEVLPLVRELKRALADSKALNSDEKLRLAQLVRSEIEGYARQYCAALLKFHLAYHFAGGPSADLHTELLNLVRPGSRFVAHLYAVADNASLHGMEEPYLAPLAECLSEFKPLVRVMGGDKKPAPKAAPGDPDREPEGLKPYLSAVAKLAEALDGSPPPAKEAPAGPAKAGEPKGGGRPPELLADQLSPLGRTALAMAEGATESPRAQAEQFLDKAGIIGALRRPFVEPLDAVYHRGAKEIERTLAQHWQSATLPMVAPLFERFPFNQGAEREVAPAELDILGPSDGVFWQDVRAFYAPVLSEQSSSYRARSGALGLLALPKDMLPALNQLAKLARALFDETGKRQPLRLSVRGLPGSRVVGDSSVQPAVAFLQVGKAAIFGFNQRASAETLVVEWWNQGVALVGIESVAARSGRKHSQTLEVADSAWSLYRLLQKTTLDSEGVSTWRILGDGPQGGQVIRFVIQPDPWAPFRVKVP